MIAADFTSSVLNLQVFRMSPRRYFARNSTYEVPLLVHKPPFFKLFDVSCSAFLTMPRMYSILFALGHAFAILGSPLLTGPLAATPTNDNIATMFNVSA